MSACFCAGWPNILPGIADLEPYPKLYLLVWRPELGKRNQRVRVTTAVSSDGCALAPLVITLPTVSVRSPSPALTETCWYAHDSYRSELTPPQVSLTSECVPLQSSPNSRPRRIQARQIAHVVAQLDDFPLQAVGMPFDDKCRHNH